MKTCVKYQPTWEILASIANIRFFFLFIYFCFALLLMNFNRIECHSNDLVFARFDIALIAKSKSPNESGKKSVYLTWEEIQPTLHICLLICVRMCWYGEHAWVNSHYTILCVTVNLFGLCVVDSMQDLQQLWTIR